jgi:hypothetical protein
MSNFLCVQCMTIDSRVAEGVAPRLASSNAAFNKHQQVDGHDGDEL